MMPRIETLEAAGGLVVDPEQRILFIFKDGKWDLPKGLLSGELDAPQTALQEVEEETGLAKTNLEIVEPLIPTHNISKYRKIKYLKRTQWFLLRIHTLNTEFSPQTEEGITHCEWIAPWDLEKVFPNCPSRVRYLIDFWRKYQKL